MPLRGGVAVASAQELFTIERSLRCCELAARGHSRDGKRDDPQIVFGLICTAQGCPIAVEIFPGNTADPATVAAQVAKLRERFGIERMAWPR